MKIKLLKAYCMSAAGDVLDLNKPVADLLIQRKIAVLVKSKKKAKKCLNTK